MKMTGVKGKSGGPRKNSGGARKNSGGKRLGAGRKRKYPINDIKENEYSKDGHQKFIETNGLHKSLILNIDDLLFLNAYLNFAGVRSARASRNRAIELLNLISISDAIEEERSINIELHKEGLSDNQIARLLVPKELIQLKRVQLQIKRKTMEKLNDDDN
jgi:hypothetical protein